MQPGIDLRMRAMAKALAEVVMPAVSATNRAAVEQGHIVMGSLEIIRQQVEFAHWYAVADLLSLCQLASDLASIDGLDADGKLRDAAAAGNAMAKRWDIPLSTLGQPNAALRDVISATVEKAFASGKAEWRDKVQALVLAHSEQQLGRERAYVAGTRWDIYPESLQSIEASLPKDSTQT